MVQTGPNLVNYPIPQAENLSLTSSEKSLSDSCLTRRNSSTLIVCSESGCDQQQSAVGTMAELDVALASFEKRALCILGLAELTEGAGGFASIDEQIADDQIAIGVKLQLKPSKLSNANFIHIRTWTKKSQQNGCISINREGECSALELPISYFSFRQDDYAVDDFGSKPANIRHRYLRRLLPSFPLPRNPLDLTQRTL